MRFNFTSDELLIAEAIMSAREVQEFLWQELSESNGNIEERKEIFIRMFQKRVDKISEIDFTNKHALVELRKRVLQQAALSILALRLLNKS